MALFNRACAALACVAGMVLLVAGVIGTVAAAGSSSPSTRLESSPR